MENTLPRHLKIILILVNKHIDKTDKYQLRPKSDGNTGFGVVVFVLHILQYQLKLSPG